LPKGELVEYLDNIDVEGSIYYYLIPSTTTLGGHGNPRSEVYTFTLEDKLVPSYLMLVASSIDFKGNMVWKVSLNGITLTREFKPQTLIELDDKLYAMQVFDITQLTQTPGKYSLKITCESSEPVFIEALYMIGVMYRKDVRASLSMNAGVLGLKPGEEVNLKLKLPKYKLNDSLILVYNSPSKRALVKLSIGDLEYNIKDKLGTSELSLNNILARCESKVLKITHEKPQITYYPKYFKIFGYAIYSTNISGPEIKLKDLKVLSDEGVVKLLLTNEGDVEANNVIIVGIRMGEIVFRDLIKKFKPKDIMERTYKVHFKANNLMLRVIYRGLRGQIIRTYKT